MVSVLDRRAEEEVEPMGTAAKSGLSCHLARSFALERRPGTRPEGNSTCHGGAPRAIEEEVGVRVDVDRDLTLREKATFLQKCDNRARDRGLERENLVAADILQGHELEKFPY